jgi:hypothetical protein
VSSLLLALATLTRLPGVIVLVPLAVLAAEQRRAGRPTTWVWLVSGPLALAGYFAFLWRLTGDPVAYIHAQGAWNRPHDTFAAPGLPEIQPGILVVALIAVAALYLFQLVYVRSSQLRREDMALVVAGLVSLALAARVVSLPRYLAVIWPFPVLFSSRRSQTFRASLLSVFVVAFAAFAYLNFTTLVAP